MFILLKNTAYTKRSLFYRLVLIGLCGVASPAFAQKYLKTADAHYQKFAYALAVEAYKKALETNEPTPGIVEKIAHCYRFMNQRQEAEFWYAQVLGFPKYNPENIKYYADAARKNGNYRKAKELYTLYAERIPAAAATAQQLIAACEKAQEWLAKPEPYEVVKSAGLNSKDADFSPVFYQDGVVFTSDRPVAQKNANNQVSGWTGNAYAKLFYAKGTGANWATPEPLPEPLNSQFQNGSAVFSKNQDFVFFTRIDKIKQKSKNVNVDPLSWVKFTSDQDYTNRLEIFISENKAGKWSEPVAFAYNQAADYSVGHPALSPDGNILYFVSDMPGGLGETDIYFSQKQANGSWGKPVNLGKDINTPGKEMFPVIALTGTLYFSSEGHGGLGGLDILAADGTGATWKNLRNLKYPLNSPQDDFGILFDKSGEGGYLSSNRESADGTDDIYTFKYVRTPCKLAGRTVERLQTKPGVYKEIPVEKVKLRLYKAGDTTAAITYSDANGYFTFAIFDGIQYTIKGDKTGYLTKSALITPDCQSVVDMIKMGMVLNRNTLNKPIVLENIYYDSDKYKIRPEAALELNKLAQTLKDNPNIKIELSSHTDSRQSHSYNRLLSQLRAEAAVTYIVSKGIDPNRLIPKGYGETRLLNRCANGIKCPEADHQVNRRTEFKLLKVQ